jgi:3-deoxy-D-manno-octulosonic acid kinase
MANQQQVGRTTLTFFSSLREPSSFLRDLSRGVIIPGKGRGSIQVFRSEELKLASREYRHGGLFRAFTGARFLSAQRAIDEADVMAYLRDSGFPVIAPFCVIAEKGRLFTRLHLVTVYEENKGDLLDCLKAASPRDRLRFARKLAEAMVLLERAGVYHPDLHLRNVLVNPRGELVFLDFDRAGRQEVAEADMIAMFRRLARFADKMEKQGQLHSTARERALFLRVYSRRSGKSVTPSMVTSEGRRGTMNRFGWFIESLFYGKQRPA